MTSINPDVAYEWHDHQASWPGIAVAAVLVAYASIALL